MSKRKKSDFDRLVKKELAEARRLGDESVWFHRKANKCLEKCGMYAEDINIWGKWWRLYKYYDKKADELYDECMRRFDDTQQGIRDWFNAGNGF